MKNIIQYPKSILLGLVTITLLSSAGNSFFELSKQLDIFGAIFKEINSIYVDDVEPSKLMRSCIDGMLKQLDPYTVFYSEVQIENSRIDNNEKLTGIGIYFNVDKDKTVVTEVIKDLAADKAGIVPGDQILTIDSKATAGKAYEDISKVLKGEAGSELSLGILKIDGTKKEVSVKRQEFVETSVPFYGMLNNKVMDLPRHGACAFQRHAAGRAEPGRRAGDCGLSAIAGRQADVDTGKVKVLAISSPQRSPLAPALPTFREQGYPELDIYIWSSLAVPAGTPDTAIARLNAEFVKALRSTEIRDKWTPVGFEPMPSTPEECARYAQAESRRWAEAVRISGFKASE